MGGGGIHSWSDRITNATGFESVGHEKILLRDIPRAQLRYFGHIARRDATSLEKVAMLEFVAEAEGDHARDVGQIISR